ncbi:MAG: DNA internalization-related competence protein ComEC/Rec2 [Candidatus Cloacimonetes bacterium]|nr:DNA internalization-related competence protein ComEC/Rec2 [Candidatus Cloacimonadota bacterium]
MSGQNIEKKPLPSPLLIPAIFWSLGIALQSVIGYHGVAWFLFLPMILSIFKKYRYLAFILLLIIAGAYRYQVQEATSKNGLNSLCKYESLMKQSFKGVVSQSRIHLNGARTYIVQTDSIAGFPVKAGLSLTTRTDTLQIGDIISSNAEFSLYEPAMNPGQYDFADYQKRKGIDAKGVFKSPPIVLGKKHNLLIFRNRITAKLSNRIEHFFPRYSGFIKAILLGDRTEAEEFTSLLRDAGIMHLMAISGIHTGIIYLFVYFIFRILLPKSTAILLTIPFLLAFLFICENSPSVLRAVLMLILFNISRLLQRDIGGLQLLSAVFLISTLINPVQMLTVGFQLSFTAVFIILYLYKALGLEWIPNIKSRFRHFSWFVNSIVLTIILSIFLLPILLYHFHWAALAGVVLSIPTICIFMLILPWSILILFMPIGSVFHSFLLTALNYAVSLLERIASVSDSLHLTLNSIRFPDYLFILYWLFIIFFALASQMKRKILFLITLIFIVSYSSLILFENLKPSKGFEIICFQVGHGDCHLIRDNDDVTMIDCGGFSGSSSAFEIYVLPFLRETGIKKINRLVLTHPHDDHYGGILPLFKNCKIDEIVVSNNFAASGLFAKWQKTQLFKQGTQTMIVDTLYNFKTENVSFTLLNPDPNGYDKNLNNQSLVTRVDYKDFSALFCGDVQLEAEERLIKKHRNYLDVDFLKAGHHGSDHTLSNEFLSIATPWLSFIPVNIKGKTVLSSDTLIKLERNEIETYISGLDGALVIREKQGRIFGETFRTKERIYF